MRTTPPDAITAVFQKWFGHLEEGIRLNNTIHINAGHQRLVGQVQPNIEGICLLPRSLYR